MVIIETSRQSTLHAFFKKRADPQPETSSEKSSHERSVQGPCSGAYKIFRSGLQTCQSKCT